MAGNRSGEPTLARNYSNDGKDFFGRELKQGDLVVKLLGNGVSTLLEAREVHGVAGDDVWLKPRLETGHISKMTYSGRLALVRRAEE